MQNGDCRHDQTCEAQGLKQSESNRWVSACGVPWHWSLVCFSQMHIVAYSSNNSNNTKNGQSWRPNCVWGVSSEHSFFFFLGFPRWLSSKESACQYRRRRFNSWVRKIPWRREWQPTPVFLPGESQRQRSLVDSTVHGVTESDTTEHTAQTNPCCSFKIFMCSFIHLFGHARS